MTPEGEPVGEKRFYVRVRGKVQGPFDLVQLQALRDRGQFRSFYEVSEDRKSWTSASGLSELFAPTGQNVKASGSERAAPPDSSASQGWYYVASDGQQIGPVSRHQLLFLRQDGVINGATLVWREGLEDWCALDSAKLGLPLDANDEFAALSGLSSRRGGGQDTDKLLWYDANKTSVFVAYLLWWFLGLGSFGGHRFYVGKTSSAVAMLMLTLVSSTLITLGTATLGFRILVRIITIDMLGGKDLDLKTPELILLIIALVGCAMQSAVIIWALVDAFLIPGWIRNYNNRLIRRLG